MIKYLHFFLLVFFINGCTQDERAEDLNYVGSSWILEGHDELGVLSIDSPYEFCIDNKLAVRMNVSNKYLSEKTHYTCGNFWTHKDTFTFTFAKSFGVTLTPMKYASNKDFYIPLSGVTEERLIRKINP